MNHDAFIANGGTILLQPLVDYLSLRHSKWLPAETSLIDFDASFYYQYYPDLHLLKKSNELAKHYLRHGLKEGRFKNLAEAMRSLESRFGPLPDDFNAQRYKLLNEDLTRVFDHDCQFTLHYLEHGRREGRQYKAEESHQKDKTPLWIDLFRLPDFVACARDWLPQTPRTKDEAVRLFRDGGIDRLAPINLDHFFDPVFYRLTYGLGETMTDVELYRHWLETGIVQGLCANEEKAFQPLLTNHQYPPSFDWVRYRASLPKREAKLLRHRVDVLRHLFEQGFGRNLIKYITGNQAAELFESIGDFHLIRSHHSLAIAAYDRALSLDATPANALLHRGDAHAALGQHLAADADFVRAAAITDASVGCYIAAARTAAASGAFERSFEILAKARSKWIQSAEHRVTVSNIIQQFFTVATRSAMALYDAGNRQVADAYVFKALNEVHTRILQMEDLPPVIAPAQNGHVAILAHQDLAECKYYRVEQKLRQLRYAGLAAQVFNQNESEPFIESLLGARAAIFYRVPALPAIMKAILTARALGIPTYYDVDDLVFDAVHYPGTFESYERQLSTAEYSGLLYDVPLIKYAMELCDHGIASTTPLARQIERIVKSHDCLVLRNGLDERNEDAIRMGREPRKKADTISIFYRSASKSQSVDFNELAGPAVLSAMQTHAHVRLVIAGDLRLRPEFSKFASRILRFGSLSDPEQYWPLISASDINLAVLSPSLVADCTSEIQWLEAAVLQVPSIVSGTATYKEILEDGVDALIVDSVTGWTKALTRLIVDRDLRREVGAAARRKALQNYSLDTAAGLLRKSLGQTTKPTSAEIHKSKAKIKVLVCHIFFPPQSYGGATRVVQDNVDFINKNCPDIEVSIFATDDGVSSPGRLRFDQYNGNPVFRVSVPRERNTDWRPFNEDNEAAFERILGVVEPDLIHFHSIHRLTASIVEVARTRKIPYFITVHDGWWISDHQFLVDEDGVQHLPSTDALDGVPPPNISLMESIARRQRLAGLLEGAVYVIAVSEAFAEIYRRAGFRNVIALANGVSPLSPAPRQRSADGKLSLGHLGGRSIHKGAMLIEAVLRTNVFDHLKLTMIDGRMEPGARSGRIWGKTPVLLRGPHPQNEIAALYASLDVLLAPSIWPESFGLVAREARSLGLWVVASDRGAMAEGIKHRENGFVIDVSDGRDLTDVLKMLDADVERYRVSPPKDQMPMRSAADQGAELVQLLRMTLQQTSVECERLYPGAR